MSPEEFAFMSRTGETFASHAAHHMYDPPAGPATGCAIHPIAANPFCQTCREHGEPDPFELAAAAGDARTAGEMRDAGDDPVDRAACPHGGLLLTEDPDIYDCTEGVRGRPRRRGGHAAGRAARSTGSR